MATLADSLVSLINTNYGGSGGGGVKPTNIVNLNSYVANTPFDRQQEWIVVWIPSPEKRIPINEKFANIKYEIRVRVLTSTSDDRLKEITDEVISVINNNAITGINAQWVDDVENLTDRRLPLYAKEITGFFLQVLAQSEVAFSASASEHNHDDRYYTKTQVDALLNYTDLTIGDETADAFVIREGENQYFTIGTEDGGEYVKVLVKDSLITQWDIFGLTLAAGKTIEFADGGSFDIFRDQDDMAADDPNAVCSQQSIKSYVDTVQTDVDGFDDELKNLTQAEIQQLENIGATTISAAQWGYLGASNQNVRSTDAPTFAGLSLTSNVTLTSNVSKYLAIYGTGNNNPPSIYLGKDGSDRFIISPTYNADSTEIDYLTLKTVSTGGGATDGKIIIAPDNVTSLTLNPNGEHVMVGNLAINGAVDGVDLSSLVTSINQHNDTTITGGYMEDLLMYGSDNYAWVPCILTTSNANGDSCAFTNLRISHAAASDITLLFELPLPTTKGSLKLYVGDCKLCLYDADVNDFVTSLVVRATDKDGQSTLISDGTNRQAAGDYTYSNDPTDVSGYNTVRVQIAISSAGNAYDCIIDAVLLECYYAT